MGLLDALLGRSKPVPANLDDLFALPSAAISLQASLGLAPTGVGALSVKIAEGPGYAAARTEALTLLAGPAVQVEQSSDAYGFSWLTARADPAALPDLVTSLHGANSAFAGAGLGPALLCTTFGFAGTLAGVRRTLALVYLFKRGSFYPFAPTGAQQRDNAVELQVRAAVAGDLRVEPDLTRWFPVWDAPLS